MANASLFRCSAGHPENGYQTLLAYPTNLAIVTSEKSLNLCSDLTPSSTTTPRVGVGAADALENASGVATLRGAEGAAWDEAEDGVESWAAGFGFDVRREWKTLNERAAWMAWVVFG